MKKISVLGFFLFCYLLYSQNIHSDRIENWKTTYRSSEEKKFDLIHTKLKVGFDIPKKQLLGEAWIQLKPHFYSQKKLILDAKAMTILTVQVDGVTKNFTYDNEQLTIDLEKEVSNKENITAYISYIANPEKVTQEGSKAISDAKGLYFINTDDPSYETTQIWTQGETESSSCWFPTIDAPNQKTTEEIEITVPAFFTTLSNGIKTQEKINEDGTRTDFWKMDLPHAPYLFFMGIGKYTIVKDSWKNIPIEYYMEKEYVPYAKDIYGLTPQMIEFYSNYTGVSFPWQKYSQITGAEYVSGAMENTTAVIHQQYANQTDKEVADENTWEDVIAHELFHHWFGDYVTAESWSNISLNESFASYGEYLWRENQYGKKHADAHLLKEYTKYMRSPNEKKTLFRPYYEKREDVFDNVSYEKGGLVLHMLRNIVGDEAFQAGIKEYLTENKFSTGEIDQLRLAFEKVTGTDLHWFFNQWFNQPGHFDLAINYGYDGINKQATIQIKQQQENLFNMPIKIGLYTSKGKTTHTIQLKEKEEIFQFQSEEKPKLIQFDDNNYILAKITDNKTIEEYINQFNLIDNYKTKSEALAKCKDLISTNPDVLNLYEQALKDGYYGIRLIALRDIDIQNKVYQDKIIRIVENLAEKDPNNLVKARAIELLSKLENKKYLPIFKQGLTQKSVVIPLASLAAIYSIDKEYAIEYLDKNPIEINRLDDFSIILAKIYIEVKNNTQRNNLIKYVYLYPYMNDAAIAQTFKEGYQWIMKQDDLQSTKTLCEEIKKHAKKYKKYQVADDLITIINQGIEYKKTNPGLGIQAQVELLNKTIEQIKTYK